MSRSNQARRNSNMTGIMIAGAVALIGSGVGVIVGATTACVVTVASKVVALGVVPKITGIIGGAVGLGWGVRKTLKKK